MMCTLSFLIYLSTKDCWYTSIGKIGRCLYAIIHCIAIFCRFILNIDNKNFHLFKIVLIKQYYDTLWKRNRISD